MPSMQLGSRANYSAAMCAAAAVYCDSPRYVVKGWLAAIMQTFESSPSVGMVGPM